MSSLDALEGLVRHAYDSLERRADSLDTKTGLALGFAGLLVSLTPGSVWPPAALLARMLAAAAGVLALRVFAVSPLPAVRLDAVTERDVIDVRERLVVEQVAVYDAVVVVQDRQLWRIHAALRLLIAALGILVAGGVIDAIQTR